MITCPYCATELEIMNSGPFPGHAECPFCSIILGPDSEHGMYAQDGQRMSHIQQEHIITDKYLTLGLVELKKLHSMDLILVLKRTREERASVYNLLRMYNKTIEHLSQEKNNIENVAEQKVALTEMTESTGREYEHWTRRCWMLENILIERLGYFPEKITEELYSKFVDNNKRSMNKQMTISKQKKVATVS